MKIQEDEEYKRMRSQYLETGKKETCYGCSACVLFCPTQALRMEKDKQGFFYPKLYKKKCTECGMCKKVCPIVMEQEKAVEGKLYAVEHRERGVLEESQSGGVFTALSDMVIGEQGVVYGTILDESLTAVHFRAEDAGQRDKMRGSKYVQSRIEPDMLKDMMQELKKGKRVLFSGTPCQCAMMQKNFGTYQNLLVSDFICHGVPSPKAWSDYLSVCTEKQGEKFVDACFRKKKYQKMGWHLETMYTTDGEEYVSNDYAALFYSHLAHRSSCFHCQFTMQRRYADITFGGFLDLQFSGFQEEYDVSMCFVNSVKGQKAFEKIKDKIYFKECEKRYFKNQPCLYHPVEYPAEFEDYWRDYLTYGFLYAHKKYVTDEIKTKYHLGGGGGAYQRIKNI